MNPHLRRLDGGNAPAVVRFKRRFTLQQLAFFLLFGILVGSLTTVIVQSVWSLL